MSESKILSGINKEIYTRCLEQRRTQQYKLLCLWREGKITGRDCIQDILDLEKIIFINKDIIKGKEKNKKNET